MGTGSRVSSTAPAASDEKEMKIIDRILKNMH